MKLMAGFLRAEQVGIGLLPDRDLGRYPQVQGHRWSAAGGENPGLCRPGTIQTMEQMKMNKSQKS